MTIDFTKYKSGHEAVASLIHQTIENRKEEDSDYSKKDFKELLNFKCFDYMLWANTPRLSLIHI